jgi:hypothetical protein
MDCDGGRACDGNAQDRLINTSNPERLQQRTRKGFRHALKPLGCRMHLFDEAEISSCLGRRAVLNMGSDVAVNLQRGFGRLNTSLQAWTRRRPSADPAEHRKPFRLRVPSVADWAYQFERTGGFNGRGPDVMAGVATFGAAAFGTQFLQHPPHYGLANMLEPQESRRHSRGVGFASAEQYERFMCKHDVVILESGLADFGLPLDTEMVSFSKSPLLAACGRGAAEECEDAIKIAIKGEEWRRHPATAYRERLAKVIAMWRRCKRKNRGFRAIFKLAPAPRARLRTTECHVAQWGFSTQAHHISHVNDLAREMVVGAGFEVFDGFGVTLHASANWFDDARYGVRFKPHESEAVSDVETQALLSQICTPSS